MRIQKLIWRRNKNTSLLRASFHFWALIWPFFKTSFILKTVLLGANARFDFQWIVRSSVLSAQNFNEKSYRTKSEYLMENHDEKLSAFADKKLLLWEKFLLRFSFSFHPPSLIDKFGYCLDYYCYLSIHLTLNNFV